MPKFDTTTGSYSGMVELLKNLEKIKAVKLISPDRIKPFAIVLSWIFIFHFYKWHSLVYETLL